MNLAQFHPYLKAVASLWEPSPPERFLEPPGGWKAFARYLERAKMAGFYHSRIVALRAQAMFPDDFLESLQRFRFHVAAQASRLEAAAEEACAAVEKSGHKAVPLKGLWLNRKIYGDASLRRTTDVDIFISPEALPPLEEHLLALGYSRMAPEHKIVWQAVYKGVGLLPVEAHLLLSTPDENPPPSEEMLARAGGWGEPNEGLELSDALIYLAINNTRDNLILFPGNLHDVAVIAGLLSPEAWESVVERAARWKWRAGVWLNLSCARGLFGAPIPAGILDPLRPSSWRLACAWAALKSYRAADLAVGNLPIGLGSLYKAAVTEDVGPLGYVRRRRAMVIN